MKNNNNIHPAFSMSQYNGNFCFCVYFSLFKILIEQKAAESSQIDWMSNIDLENTIETKHSRLSL